MGVKQFLTDLVDSIFWRFGYHHLGRERTVTANFIDGRRSPLEGGVALVLTLHGMPSLDEIKKIEKYMNQIKGGKKNVKRTDNRKRVSRKKTVK